ncbi:tRNA pseudouridine(55) synthase TruB [Haloechinothrix sp. LS1_15]|uniref:tRNA pseudouridine(55) synthase TruB n=1 Tax=Haloechinothrix sp. LS1_15 TaxID=2652248 RepID=UPI0029468230|nr:tRNA pseudouridine(55) synthase TruB [Haloechinothrix sp. LS1_15]MDV6012142.1 tRNA pseudouridine(55) synthase TruB [Haloechinothrix sp. LS1_15]
MQHHDSRGVRPGLFVVDKPAGMTSHDVVARIRKIVGTRKVGHAGTLDPMATGVLVIGVERATKILGHLTLDRKSYLATITLGAATTTDDAEGEPLGEAGACELAELTDERIDAAVAELTGDIEQVPSAVSAVKVDGVRSYARVRAGEQVDLPARPVTVYRFDRLALRREATGPDDASEPGTANRIELDVLVDCSSGTYVRALARDLGAALGVGGHLTALRRTAAGPFGLAEARTLDQLAERSEPAFGLDDVVARAFPLRSVDAATARAVRHGQRIPAAGYHGTYGIVDPDGRALALATDEGPRCTFQVVLAPA